MPAPDRTGCRSGQDLRCIATPTRPNKGSQPQRAPGAFPKSQTVVRELLRLPRRDEALMQKLVAVDEGDTGVCVIGGTAICMLTRVEVPLFESVAVVGG